MINCRIIAVDFDGTLVSNAWPEIGEPNFALIDYLRAEWDRGTKLILWTCREGQKLRDAVYFCATHGLYFDAVNDNVPEAKEEFGNNPRKIFADVYIDDKSITPIKSLN